jgi:PadR family transcriptional regulator PadR
MNDDQELKKGSTSLLILAVLSDSPRHGYAIAREIERRCADALKVGEGALYPALRALEREGMVESLWETQPSGPARRIYTLTDTGAAKLAASLQSWKRFSNAVNAVLGDTLAGDTFGGTPHVQPA